MPNDVLTRAIDALASGHDLAQEEAAAVLAEIMAGNASEAQIAAFLIALRTKGETVDELAGPGRHDARARHAGAVRARATSSTPRAPAAGARRSTSRPPPRSSPPAPAARWPSTATARPPGLSGSADVLEALGARIDLAPGAVARCIDEAGFGFMFAPAHHQATRYVVPVRKELAVRTIFNFLGPLTNPAGARRQLIGVSDPAYLERMAGALARLGVDRALVVSSEDGLDEMSTSAPTHVVEVNGDAIERYVVAPQDVGLELERRPTPSPAAPPTSTRRPRARSSPASPARRAASRCSTPAPRSTPPAWPTACARASRPPARRSTPGAALRTTDAYLELSRQLATAMSVLERIVDATRADVARRRAGGPALRARAARRRQPRGPPVLRGADAAGHLGHRRVQAPLAERRRDPPRRDGGRDRRRLRARRRRGAVDPHRGAPLRRLAGRPARGARGQRAADPAQGLHRRPLPGLRVDGGGRRRDPAHRRGARRRRPRASCTARRVGLDLDVLVEVHDEEELERALDVVDADVIGINNRDLGDFTVDVERTYELLSDVPAGKTVVSESGFHTPRAARRPRARGGRRGPHRRGAHARARTSRTPAGR